MFHSGAAPQRLFSRSPNRRFIHCCCFLFLPILFYFFGRRAVVVDTRLSLVTLQFCELDRARNLLLRMLSEPQLKSGLKIPDRLWLGTVHVDYRVPEIGRGSDATVHKSVYNGRSVAVKVLHASLITDTPAEAVSAFLERFGQECLRLSELRHPRVVELIGVGRAPNGCPCMVTELMESSLARCMRSSGAEGSNPLVQLLTYACDIAEGLRFLHGREVVHRDLKPENVLVVAGHAKLADVGLSRSIRGDSAEGATGFSR